MIKPVIGIIIGSDSDLPVISQAAKLLDEFSLHYELTIISAHRTPARLFEYARNARKSGLKVIISGAGGAAGLPGMIASLTTLPVIGVPIKSKTLNGIDSLYSIVQMPPGVPVATVAIDGAKNAAILAIQIMAVNDEKLQQKMLKYKTDLENSVLRKAEKLEKIKYKRYINENLKNS